MNNHLIQIISIKKNNFNKYKQQKLELSFVKEYETEIKIIRKKKLAADEFTENIYYTS